MKATPMTHILKATGRSLSSIAVRLTVRVGAAIAPARTVEFVARQFFKTVKPSAQRFSIVAPVRGRIEVPDGVVVSYQWGNIDRDPTIVLTHGWSGWSQQMERFVAPLQARGFAVLAFDHLAHGSTAGNRSSLPVMIRTVEHIVETLARPAGVIAHSLGAAATAAVSAVSPAGRPVSCASLHLSGTMGARSAAVGQRLRSDVDRLDG